MEYQQSKISAWIPTADNGRNRSGGRGKGCNVPHPHQSTLFLIYHSDISLPLLLGAWVLTNGSYPLNNY